MSLLRHNSIHSGKKKKEMQFTKASLDYFTVYVQINSLSL